MYIPCSRSPPTYGSINRFANQSNEDDPSIELRIDRHKRDIKKWKNISLFIIILMIISLSVRVNYVLFGFKMDKHLMNQTCSEAKDTCKNRVLGYYASLSLETVSLTLGVVILMKTIEIKLVLTAWFLDVLSISLGLSLLLHLRNEDLFVSLLLYPHTALQISLLFSLGFLMYSIQHDLHHHFYVRATYSRLV